MPRAAKAIVDIRSLARGHSATCIRALASIVTQEKAPPSARIAAASELLDRGWGRANVTHTDADGSPLQIIIRQVLDVVGEATPTLIEHDDGHPKG